MQIDKAILTGYKSDKKEIQIIDKSLARLKERLHDVPTVLGKVSASGKSFPYIESHVTVQMSDPKECDRIKNRIREKEKRRDALIKRTSTVEKFIIDMPEGTDKEIFEMFFVDGMTQTEVGEIVGYSKGRISQIISGYTKD